LKEAEEQDKKCREETKKALQRTQEIKELTAKYEEEKTAGMQQLARIKEQFAAEVSIMYRPHVILYKTVELQ
jgi:hypothetical protein